MPRSDHQHRASERLGNLELVPRLAKRPGSFQPDVEQNDQPARAPSEHYRAGLGDVARAARAVNGKRGVAPFLQALGHYCEALQSATRRAALRREITEPLDHPPRPLPVEVRCVQQHGVAIPEVPSGGKDAPVPKRINVRGLIRAVITAHLLPAEDFKSQRRPQRSDGRQDRPGDHRNLHALPAGEAGEARIVVY